jgi:hypothetical protein
VILESAGTFVQNDELTGTKKFDSGTPADLGRQIWIEPLSGLRAAHGGGAAVPGGGRPAPSGGSPEESQGWPPGHHFSREEH